MVDLWGRAGVAFHVTEEEEEAKEHIHRAYLDVSMDIFTFQ